MLYHLHRVPEYLLALEQGATREAAAPILGCTPERLDKILRKGYLEVKKYGPIKVEAFEAFEKGEYEAGRLYLYTSRAEARAEIELVRRLHQHSLLSVRATQVLLERRFPERWARVDRTEAKSQAAEEGKRARPGLGKKTADKIRKEIFGIGVSDD